MSFFKKMKDRLTKPNATISMQLGKYGYAIGENVEGTLNVTSSEEFDAKEIRCEFECVETRKSTTMQYDAALKRNVPRQVQNTATLWSVRPQVSGPFHFTAGFSQKYPLNINIPAGGRQTYHSIDQNVAWLLKGVIAIDGRPDVTTSTFEIQVAPPNASPVIKEKEILREVVMIPCKYCGSLMVQTETVCPKCGATRTS